MGAHQENWPLRSKTARSWLHRKFYNKHGRAAGTQAVEDAMRQLEAVARFDGDEHEAHLRVAEHDGRIYIDLANDKWQAVEVTSKGWRIVRNPPVKFIRSTSMRALPLPKRRGKISNLRPFLNVASENDFRLIVAFILAALRPRGPYPVLVLNGEQGSAKSTCQRMIRALIDPSAVPIRGAPRNDRDLIAAARNGWLLSFDNLSGVPGWLGDAVSRLSTGGGLGGRQLYTDHDEAVFEAQRPVMINGIPDLGTRSDLADRSLPFTLRQIGNHERRSESELWPKFGNAAPAIFGAVLDGISMGLRRLADVEPINLPRMADFARWSMACFPAFGWSEDEFEQAAEQNRADAIISAFEASPVATAIQRFIEKTGDFENTATNLLSKLGAYAGEAPFDRYWPRTPGSLGNALRRAAPLLREVGIEIETFRDAKARTVRIAKKNG